MKLIAIKGTRLVHAGGQRRRNPARLIVYRDNTTQGRGRWRLGWDDGPGSQTFTHDESTVTGQPFFRTRRAAIAHGMRKYGEQAAPLREANPAGTRVSRCVRRVKRSGRNVRSAYAICQAATRQSYATGRTLRNPMDIKVGYVVGPAVAEFRSLPRAAQYAKALARHSGKRVRVWR